MISLYRTLDLGRTESHAFSDEKKYEGPIYISLLLISTQKSTVVFVFIGFARCSQFIEHELLTMDHEEWTVLTLAPHGGECGEERHRGSGQTHTGWKVLLAGSAG